MQTLAGPSVWREAACPSRRLSAGGRRRRRYLPGAWRGSPAASPAMLRCSAALRHLLTGLQGLLLPHPGGSANPPASPRSASDGVLA